MTGEPIGQPVQEEETAQEEQQIGGFDPMTGEPIGQPAQDQPAGGFDPMTGQPIGQPVQENKPKSKLPIIIGSVVGAVVIVLLLVFSGIKSGLFLGKSGKVLLATSNTLKHMPHFVETLEPMIGLVEDEFTVEFNTKVEGVEIGGSFINSTKQKQVTAKVEYAGESIEGLAGIDSDSVKVQVPDLSKKVFVYNYKKDNTGYIVDMIGDEYIDLINSTLEQIVSTGKSSTDKIEKDVADVVLKELKLSLIHISEPTRP